jgi:peptide chain release factor 2
MQNVTAIVKPDKLAQRLSEIAEMENSQEFWQDPANSANIQKEKTKLTSLMNRYKSVSSAVNDAGELFEMANSEGDTTTVEALFAEGAELESMVKKIEISTMLDGELDANNAIVSIHPGAGGTESNDWASMIYRMYLRWSERRGFKVEVLDYQDGEEAGIKDASMLISGENVYGYLKVENGIHRLVRISPFDSNAKRHTSFCSVFVSPEIDDDIDIQIEDKDIRIDYYRASGAGGQHVNKTDSAVRMTHIATNIVVQCQNDRSQHKNKANALKMLKSRLYELELEKKQAELDGIEKSEIGWGRQIRSYVLAPYQQVKDNRSNEAYSQVSDILDGDIDQVIEDVLISMQK